MPSFRVFAATAALLVSAPALADNVKVAVGISGWTGFAPLTLANQAGIFKKNGLDVTIKKIRRRTAIWPLHQATSSVRQPPVSKPGYPGMPMALRPSRSSSSTRAMAPMAWPRETIFASIKDLKGKTVARVAPGTAPYFTLAWMLKKNGLSIKDVTVVNLEPAAAAQAFVAGQKRCGHDV